MIPAGVRIVAAASPVDMRRGFVGLAEIAREQLSQDPRSGVLLVFTNKRRDRLKLLWHDRRGLCLLYKVLDRGFFRIPEAAPGTASVTIDAAEMAAILEGVLLPPSKAASRRISREARDAALRAGSTGSNQLRS
ncbi:MAG TPA: IS66 family insertion sequence element accessory protein TnpB [Anaeromyxobacteraceae bacterium]|nr:IS66 family insertion sequence element accessory protein TnpB [Anaeromyxobacteraceae bacterium]